MKKSYQSLHENQIFIGAAGDVSSMIENEACDVIIDLRAEATEETGYTLNNPNVTRVHVPLVDKQEEQQMAIQVAVNEIVRAYQAGKKVGIH